MKQSRILISPAILESNFSTFTKQYDLYSQFTDQIDIDINIDYDIFPGKTTISIDDAVNYIISKKNKTGFTLAFHLMTENPANEIIKIKKLANKFKVKVFVHQESNIDVIGFVSGSEIEYGIAVKAETPLKSLEFYNQFCEIQLMTIQTGAQGNGFIPEILNRVEYLREIGFSKLISIDGSVNLETASLIRQHDLNRVSVGSYFSKSNNFISDFKRLDNALNRKL